jgi:hypothetical protein
MLDYCLWLARLLAVAGITLTPVALTCPSPKSSRALFATMRASASAAALGGGYLAAAWLVHALQGTPAPFAETIGIDTVLAALSASAAGFALRFPWLAPARRPRPVYRADENGSLTLVARVHYVNGQRISEKVDPAALADNPGMASGPLPYPSSLLTRRRPL